MKTCFAVAHDPERLYFVVRNEEPKMGALWMKRRPGEPYLELDDCIELRLTPAPHAPARSEAREAGEDSPSWRLVVTASGAWGWGVPEGASPPPETGVRLEKLKREWLLFVEFPVPDLALAGELRGTPLDGEEWGLSLRRLRRYLPPTYEREVMEWRGRLRFEGARTVSPAHLSRKFDPGFGVNEIRLDFQGPVPDGVELTLGPPPAKRLRAKDSSRFKCRIARAGAYRFRLWLPEAKKEGEVLPPYCAGLSFELADFWAELDGMESTLGRLKERLGGTEEDYPAELKGSLAFFEGAVIQLDRYRAPYVKDRLTSDTFQAVRSSHARAREALRKALIDRDELRVVSPYLRRGRWYRGVLHLKTDHSGGARKPAAIVKALKKAGYSFVGFADPPHGGDQDGDGKHDWNRDREVSSKARRFKDRQGRRLVVPEHRGREAYIRDYSRTATRQGLRWGKDNWKLSVPNEFVVLSGVELDVYARVSCYGLAPGKVSNSYSEIARARFSILSAPDCMLVPLPVELKGVAAIENDDALWERHLTRGAAMHFVLAPRDEVAKGGRTTDVYVFCKELTEKAILSALAAGSFYTTGGPVIKSIRAEGASVTVETKDPCHIFFIGAKGKMLGGESEATSFTYTFAGREKYARAICLEDVEEDGFKRAAYTQAFYLSDEPPPG